jgi:hypothetical protein
MKEINIAEGGEPKVITLSGSFKAMWKLTCDRRFMYLIPQLLWTGISIAYYSGNLVEMMS